MARPASHRIRGIDWTGAGRRQMRCLPGLGRSVALRQYVTDYRSDHCPRDHCIRIRSDSWNKQHSGSGRTTQDHSEPDRRSVHITTGRKISEGLPDNIDDVIVMLDAECSFRNVNDPEMDIYWGAYIGTEDEILVSGNLKGLMHDIERIRKEAKGKKGWIMDTYLLRKTTAH